MRISTLIPCLIFLFLLSFIFIWKYSSNFFDDIIGSINQSLADSILTKVIIKSVAHPVNDLDKTSTNGIVNKKNDMVLISDIDALFSDQFSISGNMQGISNESLLYDPVTSLVFNPLEVAKSPKSLLLGKKPYPLFIHSVILLPKDHRIQIVSYISDMFNYFYKKYPQRKKHVNENGKVMIPDSNWEVLVESNYLYPERRYNITKDLTHICNVVIRLQIILLPTKINVTDYEKIQMYDSFRTDVCQTVGFVDSNLLQTFGLGYFSFDSKYIQKIRNYIAQGENHLCLRLVTSETVISTNRLHSSKNPWLHYCDIVIPFKTLADGVMSKTIGYRPFPEPLDSEEAWSKKKLGRSGTMSVILCNVKTVNHYIVDVIRYYRYVGVSHVYIGIEHPYDDNVRRSLFLYFYQALKSFINNGFVTLVKADPAKEIIFWIAKPYFLQSSYFLARQHDSFVGIFDNDEFPVLIQPNRTGPNLVEYIHKMFETGHFYDGTEVKESTDWLNKPPPKPKKKTIKDFTEYSQIIFAGGALLLPRDFSHKQRSYRLGEDFKTRKIDLRYASSPCYYQKSIAITARTLIVEIHKHSNFITYEKPSDLDDFVVETTRIGEKTKMVEVIEARTPYSTRIMFDARDGFMFHHCDMFLTGRDKTNTEKDVPSEYALYYSNATLGMYIKRLLRR